MADTVTRQTADRISRLKSSGKTRFAAVAGNSGTHILRGSINKVGDAFVVQCFFTEARTNVNSKEWQGRYSPNDLRYAPAALASVVTAAFELPPPTDGAAVSGFRATRLRRRIGSPAACLADRVRAGFIRARGGDRSGFGSDARRSG